MTQITNIKNERGDITKDASGNNRIIREYNEQFYLHDINSSNEIY